MLSLDVPQRILGVVQLTRRLFVFKSSKRLMIAMTTLRTEKREMYLVSVVLRAIIVYILDFQRIGHPA